MNLTAIVDVEGSSIWARQLLQTITGSADCTSWEVNNKYYEATLEFEVCSLERGVLKDCQAIIILYDFHQEESFKRVMSFWGESPVSGAEVLLLVGVEDAGGHKEEHSYEARRTRATEWCIENGFELVVWQANHSREEEEKGGAEGKDSGGLSLLSEEDSDERMGVKRIKEALQAHMWPDMTMKSRHKPAHPAADPKPRDPLPDTGQSEPSQGSEHSSTETSTALTGTDLNQYALLPDDLVSSGIIDDACKDEMDESEFESFDRLFSQLPAMKEKAAQLPHGERVEYAEKVVMAFWKCLGTDLEEHGAEDEEELEDDSSKQ